MLRPVDRTCVEGCVRFPRVFCAVLGTVGIILFFAIGCGPAAEKNPADGRLAVFVGIPPLRYLVEQIGGKHVKVDVLVQPGQDPHTFTPGPQQAVALGGAAVFFQVGMPFETAVLDKVREGNRRLVIVDTTEGIKKLPLVGPCCEESGHDHHAVNEAEELDPHVWLSPPLLKTMAANIAEGLCRADPSHTTDYRRNFLSLDRRLDVLHRQVGRKLAPYRGRSFYVFHPGFAYFADAYGLKEAAIQLGGQMPTGKHLLALIEKARAEGVKTVFVQPEFDPQSARAVAEALGGHVVQINGLGENVIADIKDIATKIESAMREGAQQETKRTKIGSGRLP
jgi:zinc transport system substrate-binding protein